MTHWSTLEFDILETLTRKLKLMTQQQLLNAWPSSQDRHSPQHGPCHRLLKADLLLTTTVNITPWTTREPWLQWQPGDAEPDFERVWQCVRHELLQDRVPTRVYWAAPRTANLFGVRGGALGSLSERNIDLRLAEAYVRTMAQRSACAWVGASYLNKRLPLRVRPEAVIVDSTGRWQQLITVARHGVQPMKEFHSECVTHSLPYQVW